jgi:glutamyl-tRNA reductase
MKLFILGVSYKTAPVEVREQLAVSPRRLPCAGCRLKIGGGLAEVVLLSTCNRIEIYGVTEQADDRLESLFELLAANLLNYRPNLYFHKNGAAIRHLFSVASGLDSMVLGETEITGQVKQAYEAAREAKLAGPVLNRLFQTAQQTVKEIRTRTLIGRGATSVGSVAVELAEKIFGAELARSTVMIIGAGKMGEACVRHLAKRGARTILVANRSQERAHALAAEFNGRAVRFEACLEEMAQTDIVVTSTGCPHTILHRADLETVMRARHNRPLVLIDIAVPRDIAADAQFVDNVYLYNIDHLEEIVSANVRHRQQELTQCHEIITQRANTLLDKFTKRPENTYEPRLQPEPGWLLCGAAAGGC